MSLNISNILLLVYSFFWW